MKTSFLGKIAKIVGEDIFELVTPRFPLCRLCRLEYQEIGLPICPRCLDELGLGWHRIQGEERCFAIGLYQGLLKQVLLDVKFEGKIGSAFLLGVLLGLAAKEDGLLSDAHFLAAVPIHSNRLRERGFNQSQIIADGIRKVWSKPEFSGFVRIQDTKPQSGLSAPQRKKNVARAFALNSPGRLRHRKVIIVDDIVTTGETYRALARLVEASGGMALGLFVAKGV